MRAAAAGEAELLLALIRAGVAGDVELASKAMLSACCHGQRGAVALLGAGASVTATDRTHGRAGLLLAAQRGHQPVVRALLDAGADANAVDPSGASASCWRRAAAARRSSTSCSAAARRRATAPLPKR